MSASPKRYYWLKLKNTYFSQLEQKKMRKQENGVYMQIIYLKMMLQSINHEGRIYFQGVYDTIEEELAEEFSEDIDMVKYTIKYLLDNDMIVIDDELNCTIPEVIECIGSECESAPRVRKCRSQKVLQCNADVTECNADVTECNTEKEIEKRKEVDIEKDIDICADAPKRNRSRFKPPTLEEVEEYCRERNNRVDAERFIDYYSSNGWKVGKNKMKDWKAAVRTWERNQYGGIGTSSSNQSGSNADEENKSFYDMYQEMLQGKSAGTVEVESRIV